jgi:hypothetical protein
MSEYSRKHKDTIISMQTARDRAKEKRNIIEMSVGGHDQAGGTRDDAQGKMCRPSTGVSAARFGSTSRLPLWDQ